MPCPATRLTLHLPNFELLLDPRRARGDYNVIAFNTINARYIDDILITVLLSPTTART